MVLLTLKDIASTCEFFSYKVSYVNVNNLSYVCILGSGGSALSPTAYDMNVVGLVNVLVLNILDKKHLRLFGVTVSLKAYPTKVV